MSNMADISTDEVKFRHQASIPKYIAIRFEEECKQRRWDPDQLLRFILEERYDSSR